VYKGRSVCLTPSLYGRRFLKGIRGGKEASIGARRHLSGSVLNAGEERGKGKKKRRDVGKAEGKEEDDQVSSGHYFFF